MDQNEDGERPAKKQKIAVVPTSANVIKLTVSPNHQYAVVVTEDKCVRVFEIQDDGKLLELSQRFMPKRPCAIQILPDNATILCGDKFGDVYSLPLIPESEVGQVEDTPSVEGAEPKEEPTYGFKSSANNLTVHTQRNRKALEAQLKQKNLTPKTKEPLKFEHQLLLGHISMLTDLAYVEREVDGNRRGYIATADRDEHIRVSRGPPQSHIIEGYCLGHQEFVSKICFLPGTDLLVSGGGDDYLCVWNWPSFRMLTRTWGLERVMQSGTGPKPSGSGVAVSGIWNASAQAGEDLADVVVVACEGRTALGFICVSKLSKNDETAIDMSIQGFKSPILDVACSGSHIFVSFDTRDEGQLLQAYKLDIHDSTSVGTQIDEGLWTILQRASQLCGDVSDGKALDDFLYMTAKLRKRANHVETEDGED